MFNEYDHAYYYTLKAHARSRVVSALNNRVKRDGGRSSWDRLTLCSINKDAIDYARLEWPKYYSDDTHQGFQYSWESLYFKFLHRPAYFDLAIWQQVDGTQVLQGMALGKPSNGKTHLSLNWVERSFAPTYFRGGILLPVLACAEEYAKLLGSQRVLVKDAVDASVYRRYGYTPFHLPKAGDCLCKELGHDEQQ